MPRLWTSFAEAAAYARSRAITFGVVVLVRKVEGGWVLPHYRAMSNENPSRSDPDEDSETESSSYSEIESTDCGDGTSGLSSNCGETMMEGYMLFNRD